MSIHSSSSSAATLDRSLHTYADPFARARLGFWFRQNQDGGWPVRWRRRHVWLAQLAQRAGFHRHVRAPLFFGARMWVVTGEVTSSQLLAFGYSELALTALMLGWLRRGDVVVDVGSHFGYEALLAAHLVGPLGKIYAFEPNPAANSLARENLSSAQQCTLLAAAAGDCEGALPLETGALGESAFARLVETPSTTSTIEVPVTTVDRVVESRPRAVRLIKCDAEGFEERVLRGAREVLAHDRPVVVLEVGMRSAGDAIAQRTRDLHQVVGPAYEAFDFEFDGQLRLGPAGSLDVGHANIAFVPVESSSEFLALAGS